MTASKKTDVATTETPATVDADLARKIWLAGVGAYGRIYAETQGAVEKLAHGANEAFDQLVVKGEEIEDKVRASIAKTPQGERVASLMDQAKSFRQERRAALETRIDQVRKTVTETLAPLNIGALAVSVEKLTEKVEALTEEVSALKAEKAAPKAAKAPKDTEVA